MSSRSFSGKIIDFDRPDGLKVSAYEVKSQLFKAAPAVVVIQEWWGLNDQIMGVADRLAECGYSVLVPDLYRGKSTSIEEEAHHLMDNLNFEDAISQDIRGAVEYLKKTSTKVGVTGFCMGGALTLLALATISDLAAGVVWYGMPPLENIDASKIKVPVIGHWATQDVFFNIDNVNLLESALMSFSADVKFYRYLAHHAFANETAVGPNRISGTQYDSIWAQVAWDRTLTFFGKNLWS